MEAAPSQPVLLYDGECGLCNAVMRFMLKNDRRGVLMFAPLQGRTGQDFLRGHGLDAGNFDSIVFIEDLGRADTPFYLRTTGALKALGTLGGFYGKLAGVLSVVPASLRDVVYKIIARTRYRIFGRYHPTPLPDPAWRKRILD
ncbi:thiol-disulfide oxidoreductase DCC family protein [Rariglobus hedericola]|uniref:DUF393 domain-containing protein n=1 Tax=Rariglobus hedericola TaxID=2597822 RepID=A0A556QRU5_9BACT|nr:DCC1-like thiol-disulfide oxidoreductase family protein [Rariglobus hedericola]TSJ79366.1 DUF393 domain-containing protein [Rariglobus hedericola]